MRERRIYILERRVYAQVLTSQLFSRYTDQEETKFSLISNTMTNK